MKKEEIIEYLKGVKANTPLTDKDQDVIETLKSMNQVDRLTTLLAIVDERDIDLYTDAVQRILEHHKTEFVALRVANKRDDNNNKSNVEWNDACVDRAIKILNEQ